MSRFRTWYKDGLEFTEIAEQPYENCTFAAGIVERHPTDSVYLRWERDDGTGGMLLLRPDELAAIAWVATGTLWSVLENMLPDEVKDGEEDDNSQDSGDR